MGSFLELVADFRIPIGPWGKVFFDFLTVNFAWFFDSIAEALTWLLHGLTELFLWLPAEIVIIAIAGLGWYLQKSLRLGIGIVFGLLFIINQGMWKETVETLVLVIAATGASMAIGVPLGILAAHNPKIYRIMLPVLDLMQTMPTFVYLIPVLILFGLGLAPGVIVTIVFVIPASVRLTYLGVVSVPKSIIEAGEAFGATKSQLLWKFELPAALPTIMAGLTQSIMLSLSMVVFAALIGADGLGKPVVRALNSVNVPLGLEAGFAIVVLAVILDRVSRVTTGGKK